MKKKLTILISLISFCVLGIIYFQLDWMRKTYQSEFRKIKSDSEIALTRAIAHYHKDRKDSMKIELLARLSPLCDTVKIEFSKNSGALNIYLDNKHDPNKLRYMQRGTEIGGVKITYPWFQISKLNPKPKPESIPRKFLVDEKIEKVINEIFATSAAACDPLYYKSDSTKIMDYLKQELKNEQLGNLNDYAQLVFFCKWDNPTPTPDSLNIGTNLLEYQTKFYSGGIRWVSAYFHNYTESIFYQMLGRSVLSGFLILIMIFSFIYLFRIILQQKRFADMKDDFINNMTHELKTPIATISAAIEGMQSFNALQDKDKTERYLETSRKELNRLNNLVTKVLNMASYEKNEIELSLRNVIIKELVDDIVNAEKLKASKNIKFSCLITENMQIQVDPVHFRNALANLVDNAIKYSYETVEITINCHTDQNLAYFEIKDTGIGIPASQLTRIFDKFHRVTTGNIHTVKGTGLGLSYVKYVVEMHGGTITVKSEINKGTEFIISLPIK